ncbi:hypothetical protein G4Y79_10505 [Phototrophicus methaneseepsis]|uniref:Uncharacterized protein n=1 Tax=Phototrophicus methaneseepsis TaxID=2710758 RepID=A0A7S8IH15_9CHLR|nr:hypothetical protein [Phototrophicus methaneseepsis]QPC84778.1 hypothetical protein G4Y79_10505 [Phototrophicus methaneseepsis]
MLVETRLKRIRKLLLIPFGILLTLALGACGAGTADQTLVADYNNSSTLIADMRMTGTVHAARLQTTLDYSGTRVALAATQSIFLKGTLQALGYDINELNALQEAAMNGSVQFPTATQPAPNFSIEENQPTAAGSTPPAGDNTNVSPTAPADLSGSGPQLVNAALASEVGSDDCPITTTSQFTLNSNIIYLTMRAVNVSAGSTITARWLRPDGEERVFDWTPDFNIDDGCVWMYIDQTDEAFVAGVWSVTIELNGTQATDVLSFRIDDMAATG